VQVYAHTANLPQQSGLPVFGNPEGFENWLLFSSESGFNISVQKMDNCIAFQLVCAQHDTNTCQFSNAKSGFNLPSTEGAILSEELPDGWKEVAAPEGGTLLVPDPGTRRRQALAMTATAAVVWAVALGLIRKTIRNPNLGALAAMAFAGASWLAWKGV